MPEASLLICIVGPTATGKSELAERLAIECGCEILSADSMQVYRGMDIGTAKVPLARRRVSYHGIDLVDPGEPYSAALYQRYARSVIERLDDAGRAPILVGGTGFYVKAVIDDMDFAEGEQRENPVRERYRAILEERGAHGLWLLLRDADPASASVIHENDTKRVIRAFELLENGDSYHRRLQRLSRIAQRIPAIQIGIAVEPDTLRRLIDERVDAMREQGLVTEVEGLLSRGFREGITAPQAIGYKEVVQALEGRCTLDEAFERVKTATRRYAKRQRTWFRKDERIRWVECDPKDRSAALEQAMRILEEEGKAWRADRGGELR